MEKYGALTVDGVQLEVHTLTAANAHQDTTLVLLHEGLGSVAQWRDFPARLARRTGLAALVYSRRGYGGSAPVELPRPARFMHDEAFTVLPALLREAGVARYVLVGHSDGASIALLHAARFPSPALRGVVAMAPHLFVEPVTLASIAAAAEQFTHGALREGLARYHGENTEGAFGGWNRVWLEQSFRSWNIAPELATLRAPVLAIQGAGDEYGTLAQLDLLARSLPASTPFTRCELAQCGHSPHRAQPEKTLAAIEAFVAALE